MDSSHARPCHCSIVPPDLLAKLARTGTPEQRDAAVRTIASSASARTQRAFIGRIARMTGTDVRTLAALEAPAGERQTVYDAQHGGRSSLPGVRERGEGEPSTGDSDVDSVFDNTSTTYDFYRDVYGRDSVDDKGMELISSVRYGVDFDNAFWNGAQMVYGTGSGRLLARDSLVKALDVIGHELTHGVTQFTAGLAYHAQPGALNESFSDVIGVLIKQHKLGETAEGSKWLVGEGVLVPELGSALRSMKDPGKAYDGDRQPAKMSDYVELPDDNDPENDNGGVHINSGIPNHAFYLAATAIGGDAWEKAGKIWFETLTGGHLEAEATFEQAAHATVDVAGHLFGASSAEQEAVRTAWQGVEVL